MENPELPLETFSAISLMEYIRLMTAAHLINHDKDTNASFKISAEDYKKILAEPLQTPLIGLSLSYNEQNAILTVTPESDFLPQYENKIMKEVVQTFYENYKKRYIRWLIIQEKE